MSAGRSTEWWRPELAPAAADRLPAEVPGDAARAGSETPFRALMAFTFVLLLAPQSFVPALAPMRPGLLMAAIAITTYLFDRLVSRRPILRISPEIAASAALLAWAVVTLPMSYWPGGSLAFILEVYSKTLAIFCLLVQVVVTPRRLRTVAWGLALMAMPLAAFGIREYLAGRFISSGAVRRIQSYDAPLTQNPNDLALMLNLILPLTLALILIQRAPLPRLALIVGALLSVVAIILTFSRAGFITLAVTGAFYLARTLRRPGRGWALAVLVLALLGTPFLPQGYLDRLSTITNIHSDPTGSAQERWGDTQAALEFVSENPVVGAGIGMNALALNELRGALWKKIHNAYLEYAVDLGLPGLALFLIILVGCIRATVLVMRRTAARPEGRDLFLLAEGIQAGLAAFAVAALFHPVAYHFYFYYLAGLALAARAACEAGIPG
ncbi:MAG TPA: O-antigen ligase family protein [Candidatus Polarisedimenticolia bacterium]|nr:O-antigen ligase family protein [Candidatus Polarisedimenticolia bacterium]